MRRSFFCIDSHTCGNPVRLVAGGGPLLPHLPIAARRELFVRDHDWVRQALMFEPRGHDLMSGAIIYPAYREDCDFAVIFIEVSGCLPMCGAGTIGLVTAAIEEGLVTPKVEGKVSIETPAGRVDIEYEKRRELPPCRRCGVGRSGRRTSGRRHRLWRKLLCSCRTAGVLGRTGRHVGRRYCRPQRQATRRLGRCLRPAASGR
jgi:hypothetical protein